MATSENLRSLEVDGDLIKITVKLDPRQQVDRRIYVVPSVRDYMRDTLRGLPVTQMSEFPPRVQVLNLLKKFISGGRLYYGDGGEIRDLKPLEYDVWELKTADMRLIGWFCMRDIFICTAIAEKFRLVENGLYGAYIQEAVRTRNEMKLDEPKSIEGGLEYVISV